MARLWRAVLACLVLTTLPLSGNIGIEVVEEVPPAWPEGSEAYDNMVEMANFGYPRVDCMYRGLFLLVLRYQTGFYLAKS